MQPDTSLDEPAQDADADLAQVPARIFGLLAVNANVSERRVVPLDERHVLARYLIAERWKTAIPLE